MIRVIFTLLFLTASVVCNAQVKFTNMSYEKACLSAKRSGKKLLLDVTNGIKNNPYIFTVFKDSELVNYVNRNYVTARINMNLPENEPFSEVLSALTYPCVVIYSSKGEQLLSSDWYSLARQGNLRELMEESDALATIKSQNTRKVLFSDMTYEEALALSEETGKLLFLYSYTDWCRPCKMMENDVFTLNTVADMFNDNFIRIKENADTDPRDLAKRKGSRTYPSYLFIDSDDTLVQHAEGYMYDEMLIDSAKVIIDYYNNNKEIHTFKGSLNEAQLEAKNSDKDVFIAITQTSASAHNKAVNEAFQTPYIARYVNDNFVSLNLSYSPENSEIESLREKYGFSTFPALLFIDKDGDLIHKAIGAAGVQHNAQLAHEGKGLHYYRASYEDNKNNIPFLKEYITILRRAEENNELAEILNTYFATLNDNSFISKETLAILTSSITDLYSSGAERFMLNYNAFYSLCGTEAETYRSQLWHVKSCSFVRTKDGKQKVDLAAYNKFITRLKNSTLPETLKREVEITSLLANAQMSANWKEYAKVALRDVRETNAEERNSELIAHRTQVLNTNCTDTVLLAKYKESLSKALKRTKTSKIRTLSTKLTDFTKQSTSKLTEAVN